MQYFARAIHFYVHKARENIYQATDLIPRARHSFLIIEHYLYTTNLETKREPHWNSVRTALDLEWNILSQRIFFSIALFMLNNIRRRWKTLERKLFLCIFIFQCLEGFWWFLISFHFTFVWYHRQMKFKLFLLFPSFQLDVAAFDT